MANAHLLLVGDPAQMREAAAVLRDAGHRVDNAADAAGAVKALEREPADLVLAQWLPPNHDGPGLTRTIRQSSRAAGTHVIALVPAQRDIRATQALEAGADDYLAEPFASAELIARVRMGLRAAQLRAAEARLLALIANVPGAIYRCANDPDWTMELISNEIERISGYPAYEFLQNACRSFASLIHPDDREEVNRVIAEAIERGEPFALEYRIVRADGGVRWVLERGQSVDGGQGRTWLDGAIFDVTERRLAEEGLRERETERARLDEVRASRARIVDAADAARRRLERDLHDGAQQRLVALALNLRLARSQLVVDPAAAAELLEASQTELELATSELRELARGLHPPILTDRGLGPALRSLAERTPIAVDLSIEKEDRLPPSVETAAYFMVAEALTNVMKHAAASRARVTVTRRDGRAVVEVADDGIGGVDLRNSTGLRGLADRVAALDGRLELDSADGEGTLVRAVFPCG